MTKRLKVGVISAGALALVAIGIAISLKGWRPAEGSLEKALVDITSLKREVPVVKVERRPFTVTATATGSLRPIRKARIAPEVDGVIVDFPYEIGDFVEESSPLVRLKSAEYEREVEVAQAALDLASAELRDLLAWRRPEVIEQLRAEVEEANAALGKAENDYNRKTALFRSSAIPESEMDAAEEAYRSASARQKRSNALLEVATNGPTPTEVIVAEAKLRQAKANLALSRQGLLNTIVTAPYGGFVTQKFLDIGDTANANPSDEILEISDISSLDAILLVPEYFAPLAKVGEKASIFIPSYDMTFVGTVVAVNASADEQTRSFVVKVRIPNPDRILKAGLFVRVTVTLAEIPPSLSVPKESLRRVISEGNGDSNKKGRATVFVVGGNDILELREVEVGVEDKDGQIQIISGLNQGETIVSDGSLALKDGEPVLTQETENKMALGGTGLR